MSDQQLLLDPLWSGIVHYGSPVVRHWLFAGWLSLLSYVLSCLYFTWKDAARHRSKLQKDYWPTLKHMIAAALPQLAVYFGLDAAFTWLFPQLNELPVHAPTLTRFLFEVSASFVVGDFLIYWEHRLMHWIPYLRKNVHSVHHEYHAPFSWAGGWVHPAEDVVVVICQLATPLALGIHPLSLWVFAFIWVVLLIEEHSGHDVFWAPYQWLPFVGGGAAPHDIHHYRPDKNFSFVFIVWDHLFGTFSPVVDPPRRPRNYRKWWEWSASGTNEM
jgi:cholesterol 25-hydroxylase